MQHDHDVYNQGKERHTATFKSNVDFTGASTT